MRLLFLIIFFTVPVLAQPKPDGWGLFATVQFKPKFFEAYNEYFLFPEFNNSIKAREGQVIELTGHYLPMDFPNRHVVIISKFPYAACFFCGGAGPESVAEIHFHEKPPKFKADQIITVKGILQLNSTDVDHMNFILKQAVLQTP